MKTLTFSLKERICIADALIDAALESLEQGDHEEFESANNLLIKLGFQSLVDWTPFLHFCNTGRYPGE